MLKREDKRCGKHAPAKPPDEKEKLAQDEKRPAGGAKGRKAERRLGRKR